MKTFHINNVGNDNTYKPAGKSIRENWPEKDFVKKRNKLLGRPHEEAEIQHKVLDREKNLHLTKDVCAEKERVRSKVTPRKVRVQLKRRGQLNKRWGWRFLMRNPYEDPLRRSRPRLFSN